MTGELFFSQATLALRSSDTERSSRGATRSYVLHQLVSDLFGQFDERPFLYRAEDDRGTSQDVLVLSAQPPSPVERISPRDFGIVRTVRTRPYDLDVPAGTHLDFEIRVNATKDVPVGRGERSKRKDIWDAAWAEDPATTASQDSVYQDYLTRRLDGAAAVLHASVVERGMVRSKRRLGDSRPIQFVATNIVGTLAVSDARRLRATVAAGIGRSRSFGCGLLCLSRPGTVLPRRYPAYTLRR